MTRSNDDRWPSTQSVPHGFTPLAVLSNVPFRGLQELPVIGTHFRRAGTTTEATAEGQARNHSIGQQERSAVLCVAWYLVPQGSF
jgi:hypothetical protein